ncbi:asparagine linked glycosylation protein [Anaeramoeba ignava]|uniref:UDP-N-acetylglucosamine transferase subunit ALG13 n=1 Tax=Anaeramoeba ignava TaxID=1746090 RepID=A0A9Q0RIU1_ANAIG|nr:asparagine linked glycosylation protein [Anaeramoeba ignava]
MKIFVTVGTTKFTELINIVDSQEFLQLMKKKGVTEITLQTGTEEFEPKELKKETNLTVKTFKLVPSIEEYIEKADLIISHGGAGTIFESLRAKKPLIVVVNDSLMDNHQTELAEKLAEEKHLFYCENSSFLPTIFKNIEIDGLLPLPDTNPDKFNSFIDNHFNLKI